MTLFKSFSHKFDPSINMALVKGALLALYGHEETLEHSSFLKLKKKMAMDLSKIQVSDPGPSCPSCLQKGNIVKTTFTEINCCVSCHRGLEPYLLWLNFHDNGGKASVEISHCSSGNFVSKCTFFFFQQNMPVNLGIEQSIRGSSFSTGFFSLNVTSLTHSLIHHFETVPNSKKLQTTTKMWLSRVLRYRLHKKHCGKNVKLLILSNFAFFHNVFL